jgi:hypothetical protein
MMSDGDDDYDDHDDCDDDDAPASLGVMPQGGRDARGRLPASARGREACVRRAANVTMSDSERLATMTMTAMAMATMTMMTTGRQSGAVPHAAGNRGMEAVDRGRWGHGARR